MTEPIANVWSNFAYLLTGVIGLLVLGEEGLFYFFASAVLTAGSAGFHAFGGYWQKVDEFGMYAALGSLACLVTGLPVWAMLVILTGLGLTLDRVDSMIALGGFGGVVLGGMVTEELYVWAAGAVVLFAAAFAIRQLDKPVGHGPLHAVWHLLTAAMFTAIIFSQNV